MRTAIIFVCCWATTAHAEGPLRWDWQLSGPLDLSRDLDAITLDPDGVTAQQMTNLTDVVPLRICYVSVGTLENWRTDITAFPEDVIGATYPDWPDERFLDIRRLSVLLPLMQARFARCRDLGFNAIEPDNIDLHINQTGFAIGYGDVTTYVTALAGIAHGLGLQIGQKNAPDLTIDLLRYMDFAVAENCIADGWCADLSPYTTAGKPIFAAEYDVPEAEFAQWCGTARNLGLSLIFKDRDLHAGGAACQ